MCPSDFKWFSFKTKPWNALWGPKRLKCLVANGINPALAISWNPLGKMEMSNTDISNKQRCRRCPICGLLCSALLFSRLEAGALMIRQVFWPATRDATTSCSFMDLPHFSLPLHCSCINSLLARANTYSLQLANKKRAELHRELATWQPWFQHPFEIDWPEWNQPTAAPAVVLKSLHTSLSLHMASHHQVCGHTAFRVELFSCCSRIVLLDCYITLQYIT